jgi:hypothetical protein
MARGLYRKWLVWTVDLLLVVVPAVVVSLLGGTIWSYARVGSVAPPFVREAQFLAAILVLAIWVIRNRSVDPGGGEEEYPSPSLSLYRRLSDGPVADPNGPPLDAYLLAVAIALIALSVGVELS